MIDDGGAAAINLTLFDGWLYIKGGTTGPDEGPWRNGLGAIPLPT
jgi:hypothetical protein